MNNAIVYLLFVQIALILSSVRALAVKGSVPLDALTFDKVLLNTLKSNSSNKCSGCKILQT